VERAGRRLVGEGDKVGGGGGGARSEPRLLELRERGSGTREVLGDPGGEGVLGRLAQSWKRAEWQPG